MSTIETVMRQIIGDTDTPYTVPSSRLYIYLDKALDKLSALSNYTYQEDVTISATDITNGYVDVSKEIVEIISTELAGMDTDWEVYKGKRIRFYDTSGILAGTYEFLYRSRYLKFDGVTHDDTYFDYPRPEADLALVFYALALYQQEFGVIDKDGAMGFIQNKSEDGLSLSYGSSVGSGESATEILGHPEALEAKAISMMQELPSASTTIFSV